MLKISKTKVELNIEAARAFVKYAEESIAARRVCTVALAGGSTPIGVYKILASEYAESVNWARVHFFWGDERCVLPTDDLSNFKSADEALLSKIKIAPENIHRVQTELGAEQAAAKYEKEIYDFFKSYGLLKDNGTGKPLPSFDMIILGLGEDGHTASLFPGTDALKEYQKLVVANEVPEQQTVRITFTLPLINAAAKIIFLVSGTAKAEIVAGICDPNNTHPYPAKLVHVSLADWYIDADAAMDIKDKPKAFA